MIYYIFAMRCEAAPFIERFHLKKNPEYTRMDVFEDENRIVMIAGNGMLDAAMSVTELLTVRGIRKNDFFVNIGICGYMGKEKAEVGRTYICNEIQDVSTKRTYYPDMLYESPFEENRVLTYSHAVSEREDTEECLVDMEAAGIYEGFIRFGKTNQMAFIKIVSDYCDGNYPSKQEIEELLEKNVNQIVQWVEETAALLNTGHQEVLTEEEENLIQLTADRLHYSVTRRNQLKKQMIYEKLTGKNIIRLMEEKLYDFIY